MTWSRSALAGSLFAIFCCLCHFALTQAAESEDLDHDGLPDALEQQLAERYAPVVYHVSDEPNLPTDAGLFLHTAELWYYDANCRPVSRRITSLTEGTIPRLHVDPCRQGDPSVDSWTTRSAAKTRTFYLKDLPPNDRRGSIDPAWWTTYFHAYPNNLGGVTIQYWRFYSYNTSEFLGHTAVVGNHGSDWEALHVVLGPGPNYLPREFLLLGHRDITRKPFHDAVLESETHALLLSGKGGHTSTLVEPHSLPDPHKTIRHESWNGGQVRWPDGKTAKGGRLVNLGEKTAPMPGMQFLLYSGLWGTRQPKGWFAVLNSGYWGPAYNETGIGKDGFITAWCDGRADAGVSVPLPSGGIIRECYTSPP